MDGQSRNKELESCLPEGCGAHSALLTPAGRVCFSGSCCTAASARSSWGGVECLVAACVLRRVRGWRQLCAAQRLDGTRGRPSGTSRQDLSTCPVCRAAGKGRFRSTLHPRALCSTLSDTIDRCSIRAVESQLGISLSQRNMLLCEEMS